MVYPFDRTRREPGASLRSDIRVRARDGREAKRRGQGGSLCRARAHQRALHDLNRAEAGADVTRPGAGNHQLHGAFHYAGL